MPRLLLIRHGQTAWNIQRRMLGRTDIPLDDEGLAQAARLGARLLDQPPTVVYSSPMLRARQTAAAIPVFRPGLHDALGLQELDVGDLEGLTGPEMDVRFPGVMQTWLTDPLAFRPPGGETLVEAEARAWAGLQALVAHQSDTPTVAVVTHQVVLGLLLCRISGRSIGEFRSFFHKNTAITEVAWSDTPQILRLADADHL